MKYTLLEMTQDIASSLSSDEVNSISDTAESMQIATCIKQKYFDIINRTPQPEQQQLVQLDPSLDLTMPILMTVPDGITDIKWLKYFNTDGTPEPGYQYVNILPHDQFIDMVTGFNPDETNIASYTFTDATNSFSYDFTLYYRNDRQPSYCTVINNRYVLFDSYDASIDSTLQSSKVMAWGRLIPHWSMTDNFIPELSEDQFQLLLNEAKMLAFYELKQQPHQLALQETKRGWSSIQKNKAVVQAPTYFESLPNFGRRPTMGTSFFKQMGWDR